MGAHRSVHLLFENPDFPDLILVIYVVQKLLVFLLRRWEEVALQESFNRMLKQNENSYNFQLLFLKDVQKTNKFGIKKHFCPKFYLKIFPFLWNVTLGDLLERSRTDEHVNQGDRDANGNSTEQKVKVDVIFRLVPLEATWFYDERAILRHASRLSWKINDKL